MRKCKKLLGVLLTSVLIFTAIIPNFSFGAENGTTVSTNDYLDNGNESGQDIQIDTNQKSLSVKVIPELPVITEKVDNVSETQIQLTPNVNEPILAADYDVTSPVIEKVEFAENGKILTSNDTLNFKVWAYDADSGIKSIEVYIYNELNNGKIVYLNKMSEDNLYEGSLPCNELNGSNFNITDIKVEDNQSNIAPINLRNGESYIYNFSINNDNIYKATIVNIQMNVNDNNQNTLIDNGDIVTYTATINCENFSTNKVTFAIQKKDNNNLNKFFDGNIISDTDNQLIVNGIYTIDENTNPGNWTFLYISLFDASNRNILLTNNDLSNSTLIFNVSQDDNFDSNQPIIKNVFLDKNGEFVTVGDKITLTVEAEDANLPQTITGYFYPTVSNVSSMLYLIIELNLNDNHQYIGELEITDDTYPCMWELRHLVIRDLNNNETNLSDYCPDLYTTYPWYFKVKSGNTYVEEVKDITFNFNGYKNEENPYIQTIFTQTVKNVGRRSSLKELGILFPELDIVNGYLHTGWTIGNNGKTIDENSPLLFTDSVIYIYAKYDKTSTQISGNNDINSDNRPSSNDSHSNSDDRQQNISTQKSKSDNNETTNENISSVINMSESQVNDLITQIKISSEGTSIPVDMGSATIIPKEVLEELRGKAVDIILNMGGYSWVINGKDIAATNLYDINLEVKLDTNAVPTSLVKSIAGDKPTKQLSLTHNGDFGFRADLILNLGSEHSGEFGNLYYYDSSSKLVFMDAGQINTDGTVRLSFSHASDYVIIISENIAALSSNSVPGARKSPKTGE